MAKAEENRKVPAIKVRQWLEGWDRISFDATEHRRKPEPHFYMFSMPALELRSLCGIVRRQAVGMRPRAEDLGIQREHDPDRSEEIARFVEYGYPWSTLSESKRASTQFNDLRKPGWLPTAIVVNILTESDRRSGATVAPRDLVHLDSANEHPSMKLPYSEWSNDWRPIARPPLEVIDGQHRLWAFDHEADSSFELPVVAFHGLDVSWQAYLFWTINIKPKRINPSLAFDLYPLLRSEDWLDRAEGHAVYRETRAQELTEALWSHPSSPWYERINMLGERQVHWATQSAWIKSLVATFVRPWAASKVGGLYGSRLEEGQEVLEWSRAQQAAFLIFAWDSLRQEIAALNEGWAKQTRIQALKPNEPKPTDDPAFYGQYTLLTTDQGIRGYLHVLNDMCFVVATKLSLREWDADRKGSASDSTAVSNALAALEGRPVTSFVRDIAKELAAFDWRTSAAADLSDKERREKLVFRGSSGYRELRAQLLDRLRKRDGLVGDAAKRL